MGDAGVVAVWLRDVFVRITNEKILDITGETEISFDTEEKAYYAVKLHETNKLFLRGNNLFEEIDRFLSRTSCNAVVNLVITGLRDVYWQNRYKLPPDLLNKLSVLEGQALPTFFNVFEYESLRKVGESTDVALYQLFNDITEFDIVHIPLTTLISTINQKRDILLKLPYIDLTLELSYEQYDLYNLQRKALVEYINPERCFG